jgi:hypothetical protein
MPRRTSVPRQRVENLTAYPLYATPTPWPWNTSPDDVTSVTDLKRLKDNLMPFNWGGRESLFAAIASGSEPPYAFLRLIRLKKDSIDRVDIEKLQEELISPGEHEYLGQSLHFVLNTSNWLALGEYNPQVLHVLGEWPSRLLNRAFSSAARPERPEFHPFPSKEFRDVVVGKAIKRYSLKLGPASVATLEDEGFGAESIRRIIANDQVVGVDVTISVHASEGVEDERVGFLEAIAEKFRRHRARMFRITTEEGTVHDLLRENFVRFSADVTRSLDATPTDDRRTTFGTMGELLRTHEDELLGMIPPIKARALEFWERDH